MIKVQLEQLAVAFRVQHGIGATDPIRLKSLLSHLNVISIYKPLSGSFSGMAIKITEAQQAPVRFMLINSNHSKGKQHFTICHELYHLFIQKNFDAVACETGMFKKGTGEEYNADVFASYLLLPENGIKSLIPFDELAKDKIQLKTILKLEHYFSCSRSALLYRLKDLGLITSKCYDKYVVEVKKSAVAYGYSTDLYEPANENLVIGDYGELAKELFDRERISEMHYLSLLQDLGMNSEALAEMFHG